MFAILLVQSLSKQLPKIEIPQGLSNADACSVCKTVVSAIQSALKNSKVQSYVKNAALKACNKLSNSAAKTLCNSIVNNFLGTIMNLASSGLAKANICQRIKLCGSNDEEYYVEEVGENSYATCAICLAQQIAIYGSVLGPVMALKKCPSICAKNSDDEVENGVFDTVGCYASCLAQMISQYGPINGPINAAKQCPSRCSNGVEEESNNIFEYNDCVKKFIYKGFTAANESCYFLYNRNDGDESANGDAQCATCVAAQVVIHGPVLGLGVAAVRCKNVCIGSNDEDEEVEEISTLEGMVQYMKCYSEIVRKYGPAGILRAPSVCKKYTTANDDLEIEIPAGISNVDRCNVCKIVVKWAQNVIDKYHVDTSICKKLPLTQLQTLCTSIIEKRLPTIIDLITKKYDAETICKKVKLC
ncbi:saposin-like protein 1 [Histomonas meleagridis]|uniref:saposin-like protein 1 n=1 Tax=Histomonas meleagridis TaxID=135588 RepID=UPI00355A02D6|nr:saposin-like protein 1 [Histomonas meleagridis]KAH0802426.1 saposin-like protein 1 [Histomonas meleagridis]